MVTNPLLGYVQNLEVMFNQNAPNKAQCVLINHTAPAVQVKSSSGTPQRACGAGGSGRQIAGPLRLRHLSLAGPAGIGASWEVWVVRLRLIWRWELHIETILYKVIVGRLVIEGNLYCNNKDTK